MEREGGERDRQREGQTDRQSTTQTVAAATAEKEKTTQCSTCSVTEVIVILCLRRHKLRTINNSAIIDHTFNNLTTPLPEQKVA